MHRRSGALPSDSIKEVVDPPEIHKVPTRIEDGGFRCDRRSALRGKSPSGIKQLTRSDEPK